MAIHPVRVTSAIQIAAPTLAVWAKLCDAEMPATAPCEFHLGRVGPPRPVRCELPDGPGAVGATRRCVSDRGTVTQRVTEWAEGERLAFELVAEDAGLGAHVAAMRDVFELEPAAGGGTRLTRRTEVVPCGPCPRLRGLALAVAVRRVHRFTMRGFQRAVEDVERGAAADEA